MARFKVLEVIRQGQIGGGESHLLDLIYFLDKEKVEPVCLSFTDGEMIRRLTQMGITCHIINTKKPFEIAHDIKYVSGLYEQRIRPPEKPFFLLH